MNAPTSTAPVTDEMADRAEVQEVLVKSFDDIDAAPDGPSKTAAKREHKRLADLFNDRKGIPKTQLAAFIEMLDAVQNYVDDGDERTLVAANQHTERRLGELDDATKESLLGLAQLVHQGFTQTADSFRQTHHRIDATHRRIDALEKVAWWKILFAAVVGFIAGWLFNTIDFQGGPADHILTTIAVGIAVSLAVLGLLLLSSGKQTTETAQSEQHDVIVMPPSPRAQTAIASPDETPTTPIPVITATTGPGSGARH